MPSLRLLYRAARYRWRNDRRELDLIRGCLSPGDVAVDIGAHKGGYLYWLRKWVGSSGEVWAFEPQKQLCAELRKASRHWPRVRISDQAVSDEDGVLVKLVLPEGAGESSPSARVFLLSAEESKISALERNAATVSTVTLDHLFRKQRPPDLIKCDCEGHELEVFRGAKGLLSRHQPALLFECEARHRGTEGIQPVFDFLLGLGYKGWRVDRSGLTPLSSIGDSLPGKEQAGNNYWFVGPHRRGGKP